MPVVTARGVIEMDDIVRKDKELIRNAIKDVFNIKYDANENFEFDVNYDGYEIEDVESLFLQLIKEDSNDLFDILCSYWWQIEFDYIEYCDVSDYLAVYTNHLSNASKKTGVPKNTPTTRRAKQSSYKLDVFNLCLAEMDLLSILHSVTPWDAELEGFKLWLKESDLVNKYIEMRIYLGYEPWELIQDCASSIMDNVELPKLYFIALAEHFANQEGVNELTKQEILEEVKL